MNTKSANHDNERRPKPSLDHKKTSFHFDGQFRSARPGVRNGTRKRDLREQVQSKIHRDFSFTPKKPSSTTKRVEKLKKQTLPTRKNSIPSLARIEALQSSLSSQSPSPSKPQPPLSPSSSSSSSKTVGESPSVDHLLDPSWFFPVGQTVVHRQYGKGVVLGHPPCEEIDDATVLVQFANGRHMEFPALGTEILPDM